GLIIGIGFGTAQVLGGAVYSIWTLAPGFMDWWKAWELTTGFVGGSSCALALCWVQRHVDGALATDGSPIEAGRVVWPYLENQEASGGQRRAAAVTSVLALLALLLVAWYGSTYFLGIDLGLYAEGDFDQYELQPARVVLAAIGAGTILAGFSWRLTRHVRNKNAGTPAPLAERDLHRYVVYLVLYLFIIGIYTIWEMRIAILYAVCLGIALVALDRIDQEAGSLRYASHT
ncbi:MAG: hypothetical protein JW839_07885, partial [Candidatus Lokiarchaeota archaeon]|nr:hypothetical protein [Candidatus Lokiarchaeota archaeon]